MKFLIIESCSEDRTRCSYTQGKRVIEAASLEDAKAEALDGDCGYYPFREEFDWEHIAKLKRSHTIKIYQITEEFDVDLQSYLDECLRKQATAKQNQKDAAERAEYERLKAKFEAVGCSHPSQLQT